MPSAEPADCSNGYESAAADFIAARSPIGAAEVQAWARSLPRGGAVLDLGCGHGEPVTRTLLEEGLTVYGIDASPGLLAELRRRFPSVTTECAAVEESGFFGRTFDGIVAWGLLFLLRPDAQALVIRKVARALEPGGQFLFTAPSQACEWRDALTGRHSRSLGAEAYRALLRAEGMALDREGQDDGANHYYGAAKQA